MEPKQETKAVEYVIGGLCAWHVLMGSIGGVLQVLGFDLSLGGASVIALVIIVFALLTVRQHELRARQARTQPQRKISAPDYFTGVFSVWILAMAITALVARSVGWASLIALCITVFAFLTVRKHERGRLRTLSKVDPLAKLLRP